MTQLPKGYDPAQVEGDLYADWEASGIFHAEHDDDGDPFSIVIPPPNVTGSLHTGHALDNAIQDAIIRRERMRGRNTVWVPGTDHAGIATQNVVERMLEDEGLTRHDVGREAFIQRVWEWREESGGIILDQLRRLGASCDWDREAFTFDEPRSRAVREVFVSLHEQGLIYRGMRLINWCPRCATALSDIEVEHLEVEGELAHFRYLSADGSTAIQVATTRAETMLGDTAVAVHPDDDRYTDLVGTTVVHPFFDREIPVIADEDVDPEFGTGAVKVTPAHDPTDHAMSQRHGLAVIDILDDDARINASGGERFRGLDRFDAREAVKEALDEDGLLDRVESYTHSVGHCDRCGTMVEPRLSEQWFVSVGPLAEAAIDAVEAGRVRFVPHSQTKPFLDWLRNLRDWCISRQIWWGHRIPAWYCPDGHVTVARDEPDACAECGKPDLTQDEDVLDTWFSSQLWPFTVFGWPDDTPELRTWFPTSVLVTGYDINTFWVSRMVMIALRFLDDVPFSVVHNHGMVRDEHGKKMSKSFGNVIDPLDFIDRYGADALRFALFQHCSPGVDVPLAEDWVEGARRFANKLWNAIRFALGTLDGTRPGDLPPDGMLALEDRWILSRLEATREAVDEAYDRYEWSDAAERLFAFAWRELADWYLEAAKVRLYGDDEGAARTARRVLARVLDDLLRLLHPLMPFVTETLWRTLNGSDGGHDSLAAADWPQFATPRDTDVEQRFGLLTDLVTQLRRFRSQNNVPPSVDLDVTVVSSEEQLLRDLGPLVRALAGVDQLRFADSGVDEPGVSRIVFVAGEAYVPLAGLVDVDAELERLRRDAERARAEVGRCDAKLANTDFVERAPAEVVDQERDRRAEWQRVLDGLADQIATLEQIEGDAGAGGGS